MEEKPRRCGTPDDATIVVAVHGGASATPTFPSAQMVTLSQVSRFFRRMTALETAAEQAVEEGNTGKHPELHDYPGDYHFSTPNVEAQKTPANIGASGRT